jgi:tRNA 2-thiouridine synthesizing protein A
MAMVELDLRGLRCPLPALRTERALRGMQPGDRLSVLSDDPLAAIDIPHLCRQGGHALVETQREAAHHRFLIARGPAGPEAAASSK